MSVQEDLTTEECIHILENSTLQSTAFTQESVAAAYIVALAALREKAARENPAPLTPEQIRQMRGKPVWCPEVESYGIIALDKIGNWADKPFLKFFWLPSEDANCGTDCNYDVEARGLTLYPYKPQESMQKAAPDGANIRDGRPEGQN